MFVYINDDARQSLGMSLLEEVGSTYSVPIDSLVRCLPITLLEAHCLRQAYGDQMYFTAMLECGWYSVSSDRQPLNTHSPPSTPSTPSVFEAWLVSRINAYTQSSSQRLRDADTLATQRTASTELPAESAEDECVLANTTDDARATPTHWADGALPAQHRSA